MSRITVNFDKITGKVKPMHCVNNGPIYKFGEAQRVTNMDSYKAAGIPYQRNHDASFCSTYGGEHTVDVNFIFPNFDADPYDEANYDFDCTDEYMRVCELSGAKTFYRLGSKIEHTVKKYNTLPPKDFKKWAVICEHIIRHYCYGWANGFYYDIEYWEIWNEPDGGGQVTWGGTEEEFFELYHIAATHLKECFPEKKIGGPALAWSHDWADRFVKQLKAPLDFFSWHAYWSVPQWFADCADTIKGILDKYGFTETESILNEWNYVDGWTGDKFLKSLRTIPTMKGAAFTSAVMAVCHASSVDMLMYYDARPCGFNGLWAPYTYDILKGYYTLPAFNELYKLGKSVAVERDDPDVYIVAAKGENKAAMMLTHYTNEDNDIGADVELDLTGLTEGMKVKFYLLDEEHDLELVKEEEYSSENMKNIKMSHNSVMLITFEETEK